MTVVDPDALTAPGTIPLVYARADGLDRLIYDTFSNDRSKVANGVFPIGPPDEAAV